MFTNFIISQENIAKRMGIRGKSFVEKYNEQVMELNRLMLGYVKDIRYKSTPVPRSSEIPETGRPAGSRSMTGDTAMVEAAGVVTVGSGAAGTGGMAGTKIAEAPAKTIEVKITENGFPKLPIEVKGDLKKKEWEKLLRPFLSHHYSASFHDNLC
jgi:hypothetical protein